MDGDGDIALAGVTTDLAPPVPRDVGHGIFVDRTDCGGVVLGDGFGGHAVIPARVRPVREPADVPDES